MEEDTDKIENTCHLTYRTLPEVLDLKTHRFYEPPPCSETLKMNRVQSFWISKANDGNPHFSPFRDQRDIGMMEMEYSQILMEVQDRNQTLCDSFSTEANFNEVSINEKPEGVMDTAMMDKLEAFEKDILMDIP